MADVIVKDPKIHKVDPSLCLPYKNTYLKAVLYWFCC